MTPIKILIADDHLAELHLLALHLRNEDYDVATILAADEVVGAVRQWKPDLLLVEVAMSEGSVGVYEMLTDFPDLAAIPTLYLVGRKSRLLPDNRRSVLPPSVMVEKPVVVSDLLSRVTAILGQADRDDGLTRQL